MIVALCLCLLVIVGCGSSASTSRAEVAAVAAAEQEFTTAYRRVNVRSRDRCEAKASSDAAFTHCYGIEVRPLELAAESRFAKAIDKMLAAGVGSECSKALESAVGEISQIPLFSGEATEACQAESRSE